LFTGSEMSPLTLTLLASGDPDCDFSGICGLGPLQTKIRIG
jgi:hypothetical protein